VKYSRILRIIIRDDAPLIHANDSPSFRSTFIELDQRDIDRLNLGKLEEISRCFIEPEAPEVASPEADSEIARRAAEREALETQLARDPQYRK